MSVSGNIKVLIVDDSAMTRRVLASGLSSDPEITVVGTASGAEAAWRMMQEEKPDVVTLDIEMPGMDGLTFLKTYLPRLPIPTVIISSMTRAGTQVSLRAMEAGAVDIITKPTLGLGDGLPAIMKGVCARVRAAATARVSKGRPAPRPAPAAVPAPAEPVRPRVQGAPSRQVIAIGASTGGVQALSRILPLFPADSPAIVIVQHMPEGFTAAFAQRLNMLCPMAVREAKDGELLQDGTILIAPGGTRHMALARSGQGLSVRLVEGEPVAYSRPSVNVLFDSVARLAGRDAVAALLTGMGRDGATGMLAIREAGGRTLAQDEATCVVNGMPQAACDLGAVDEILPLDSIPARLLSLLAAPRSAARL
jgi:two-component system chemotaxis response regulator CheB